VAAGEAKRGRKEMTLTTDKNKRQNLVFSFLQTLLTARDRTRAKIREEAAADIASFSSFLFRSACLFHETRG